MGQVKSEEFGGLWQGAER